MAENININSELVTDKRFPYSVEAEYAVIGSMLIDKSCIPQVIENLVTEDFYISQNKDIYDAIYAMFSRSQPVDAVTVMDYMRLHGTFSEENTRKYILDLIEITPTSANVMEYVAIVKDKSLLRKISETAGEIIGMVQNNDGDGQSVLDVAEQRIYAIRQGRASKSLAHVSYVMQDVFTRLEELAQSDEAVPGLPTGLSDLDRAIAGLNKSDLILIAARPGMGKTSLGLNILLQAGKKSNKAVVFFSLEMSREQLAMRLLSSQALLENNKLVTGKLEEEDWISIARASAVLSQTQIFIDDNPMLTVADMLAKCRRVKNLGLVCVDYLQLMQSAGGERRYSGENRQQVVSDISRNLKIMAKELDVPILCLSQLSRASESRNDKRPMLSDLRESGAIEQDADIVIFIYRDGYYNQDSENPNEAELIIAKNRHGETGKVLVNWVPQYTTFSTIEKHLEEPPF